MVFMSDFMIFHTNDLHGKLRPELAETITAERKAAGLSLLLDAGDAVSSGNIYFRPGGEPVLAGMNELGYDAMAMGNREFHFMEYGLKSKVGMAEFPVLCANLEAGGADVPVGKSALFDLGGTRVAVLGLCVPMITRGMAARKVSPFLFDDPVETAAAMAPELKENSDFLIALTHIGLKRDLELAEKVPGIDLIIGGHSHDVLREMVFIGDTAVAQAGWWGNCLGRIDVSLSEGRPRMSGDIMEVRSSK